MVFYIVLGLYIVSEYFVLFCLVVTFGSEWAYKFVPANFDFFRFRMKAFYVVFGNIFLLYILIYIYIIIRYQEKNLNLDRDIEFFS